jgi:hypothetical protein
MTMAYREFTSAEQLLEHYAEVRKRLYHQPKRPKPAREPQDLTPQPKLLTGREELYARVCEIAAKHDVDPALIYGRCRRRAVILARQEAYIAVAAMRPRWSVVRIAKHFNKHHTSVLHSFGMAGYEHGRECYRDTSGAKASLKQQKRDEARARMEQWLAGVAPHPSLASTTKLTVEQVREIKATPVLRREEGRSLRAIPASVFARRFGVDLDTIYNIWNRKTWRHVR